VKITRSLSRLAFLAEAVSQDVHVGRLCVKEDEEGVCGPKLVTVKTVYIKTVEAFKA
jgi:hypothetical protein